MSFNAGRMPARAIDAPIAEVGTESFSTAVHSSIRLIRVAFPLRGST
jgi:hypothetical protein